jgi:hypothetical protein
MKSHKDQSTTKHGTSKKRPNDWSPAERLELLMESHGLDEEALNAFCREKGTFRHHLQQWRAAFEAGTSPVKPSALRELKETNKALARELKRKEKALVTSWPCATQWLHSSAATRSAPPPSMELTRKRIRFPASGWPCVLLFRKASCFTS